MSLSASALQLAGFLMAHGLWTISDAPGERYVPQALCETSGGERRLVTFDAASEDESLRQARSFMGTSAGQFAECALSHETSLDSTAGGSAEALTIELTGADSAVTIVQAFRPAGAEGGFRLLGDELLLDDGGRVLPRSEVNGAIVSLREGAADHPGLADKWPEWNTGRDPVNPLIR